MIGEAQLALHACDMRNRSSRWQPLFQGQRYTWHRRDMAMICCLCCHSSVPRSANDGARLCCLGHHLLKRKRASIQRRTLGKEPTMQTLLMRTSESSWCLPTHAAQLSSCYIVDGRQGVGHEHDLSLTQQ